MTAARRLSSPAIFLFIAAAVYTAAFYVRGLLATADSPDVLAAALVVDLVILVPVAYYLLVVRRTGLPTISVAGIFIVSLIAAGQIIPSEHGRVLKPLEVVAALAEVALLTFIAVKAVRGVRRFRAATARQQDADAFDAIRRAAREAVDSPRVADLVAYELTIMYYALGTWRQRLADGAGRYTSYKDNNYGSTLFGIGVLLVVELIAVHLLVQHYWSATGAWILSILSVYAGLWLMGDWHALRLRPTTLSGEALHLRTGMRWQVDIPFDAIASFRRVSAIEDKPRGALNLVSFGDASFEIATRQPVEAAGPYGSRKSIDVIWFAIDGAADFEEALRARLARHDD